MATIFAISRRTNIPRAYDVPSFVDLNANPDLEPYVISDKNHIIGSLMENQTKKDMLVIFETCGIPIRGTSKKTKEELASIIADKFTEGLVPNEEPRAQPNIGVVTLDGEDAISTFTAMILAQSLKDGGDQAIFKKFIQNCIDEGVGNPEWLENDAYALELLEVARDHTDGFMDTQYHQLLEKKARADALNEPEDQPASSKDEVGKVKNVPLNDLATHSFKVRIKVVGSEKSFVFGFDSNTHFSELFEPLSAIGINVGNPIDEPSAGGISSAMGHEIVSDWVNDGGSFDLVPLLQGGGKKGVRQNQMKKVAISSTEVKNKAMELAKSVMSSTRATVGDLADLEKTVNQFWTDADTSGIKAFENLIKELDKSNLEKLQQVISSEAGGDTEYKLRQMSYIIFGKPIINIKKLYEDLDKTIGACELAVKSA